MTVPAPVVEHAFLTSAVVVKVIGKKHLGVGNFMDAMADSMDERVATFSVATVMAVVAVEVLWLVSSKRIKLHCLRVSRQWTARKASSI